MSGDPNVEGRFDVSRVVVLTCAISAVAVAVLIILAWLYLAVSARPVPETLDRHLSAAIVFLFTGGFALVKDFISGEKP
jgi:hypothetical protein